MLANRIITQNKQRSCPIGWSIIRSPECSEQDGMNKLIKGLWLYHNNPQIDFIEINEHCPNIDMEDIDLASRLEMIAQQFLQKRTRHLPVIVKFSNDTSTKDLPYIMELLLKLKFDGITLGNTSVCYNVLRSRIDKSEQNLFDYFNSKFGGGISGRSIKTTSLELCTAAVAILKKIGTNHEFHIIRSGGIETYNDIEASDRAGVSLNQWYTGFFENYGCVHKTV